MGHRIVLTSPSSHSKEKDPSWKHPHTLLCVVLVVHRILLTLPSSNCKEKDPSWKHPHTLPFVIRVVHRIVLTFPVLTPKRKTHHQGPPGDPFLPLTNDIAFPRNVTSAKTVYPGLNKSYNRHMIVPFCPSVRNAHSTHLKFKTETYTPKRVSYNCKTRKIDSLLLSEKQRETEKTNKLSSTTPNVLK